MFPINMLVHMKTPECSEWAEVAFKLFSNIVDGHHVIFQDNLLSKTAATFLTDMIPDLMMLSINMPFQIWLMV